MAGFKGPTKRQRVAATKSQNKVSDDPNNKFLEEDDRAFPAPLLLPGDDLSEDPDYPAQSFQEWFDDEDRNPVTPKQNKIYLCSIPEDYDGVEFLREWRPQKRLEAVNEQYQPPSPLLVQSYLAAFYHGLPVSMTQSYNMRFTKWDENKKSSRKQKSSKYVGLDLGGW